MVRPAGKLGRRPLDGRQFHLLAQVRQFLRAQLPGAALDGMSFGAQPGRDFALFSLDAEARNRSGMILGVGLETSVSHESQSYYGMGRLGFTW